jgi:hypothetical protein
MRSFLFWLLALGLGFTGYDAVRGRDSRDVRRPFGERAIVVSPVDHAAVSEGGNGLPPPPRK